MTGLLWVLVAYAATTLLVRRLGLVSLTTPEERRAFFALLLVLAGAHSTAVRAGAADVAENPIVLETALRGLLDLAALVVAMPLATRMLQRRAFGVGAGAGCLLVYLAVAAVSTLYSAAPIVTAGKAFELGVALFVVLAAVGSAPGDAVGRLQASLKTVVLLEAGLLAVALAGFLLMPGTFSLVESRPGFLLPQTLASPYAHSNSLSSMAALVSVYGFAEFLTGPAGRWRRVWAALGCLGVVGVVLASGRQGVAMWAAGMAVLLWFCRRRWFVLLLAPTAVGLLAAYRDVVAAILTRGQASVTLSTWSGRFDLWGAALEVWKDQPWLGYGFGVGGRFVALQSIGRDDIPSLHSGYMEALTGVGVFGLLPLAFAAALVIVWAIRSLRAGRQVPMAVMLVPLLLRTLVSDGFGSWVNAELLIFAILVLAADQDRLRMRARRRSASPERGEFAQHRPA